MKRETRTAVFDKELKLEAYRLEGIIQPFPNHFHEHYVIGFVESGERCMSCRNKTYSIKRGDIILFNPWDSHACVQSNGGTFDYRGLNISKSTMLDLAEEAAGKRELPEFSNSVVRDEEIACYMRSLHEMAMSDASELGKEENLLLLISALIQNCGQTPRAHMPECRKEIENACEYIRSHSSERIYLEQICRYSGLSKSTLLRAFAKSKGVTPYRYLEMIRINEAKALLENGAQPLDAAMRTGFSDQSHFTNYFTSFIGLAPGAYREMFFRKNRKEEENGLKK